MSDSVSELARTRHLQHMATALSSEKGPTSNASRLIVADVLDLLFHCGIDVDIISARRAVYLFAPVPDAAPFEGPPPAFCHYDGSKADTFDIAGGICQLAWFLVHKDHSKSFNEMERHDRMAAEQAISLLREIVQKLLPQDSDA